jgi:hypothetical protein
MVHRQGLRGSRLRLCFASPSHEQIREGVAVLAEVCRKEFGVPARIANVENARGFRPRNRTADQWIFVAGTIPSIGSASLSSPPPPWPGARPRFSRACCRSIPGRYCSGEACSAAA